MSKIIKLLVLLVTLIFITCACGADKTGYLSVSIEEGMQIYIDTSLVGKLSFYYLVLAFGKYSVDFYNDKTHVLADRGSSKNIEIQENEYIKLNFVMTDQVKVLSLPIGGKVFAGDDLIGNTPITFNRDLIGTRTIKIEKNGYAEQCFYLDANQNEYNFILVINW